MSKKNLEGKVKELEIQRNSIQSQVNQFALYIGSLQENLDNNQSLQEVDIIELQISYDKVIELRDKFEKVQDELEIRKGTEDEFSFRNQFEGTLRRILAHAKLILDKHADTYLRNKNNSPCGETFSNLNEPLKAQSVRLPIMELPKFDGTYSQWVNYRDTFESVINNNNTLDNILKLQYLRSSLTGEAAREIACLEISSQNFAVAWNLLCQRYDKKRLLVKNHSRALLNLKQMEREDSKSIRTLVSEAKQHVRALEHLKQNSWDTLIVELISSKLDVKTACEWERKLNGNDVPSKKELFEFLEGKADQLENVDINKHPQSFKHQGSHTQNKFVSNIKSSSRVYLATNTIQKCAFCNGEHNIGVCSEFSKLAVDKRLEQIKQKSLCINCLRTGHYIRDCKAGFCKICRGKHNTLLHIERPKGEPSSESNKTQVYLSKHSPLCQTLLATVLVYIYDKNGGIHIARALLDSGSQSNLMTSDFSNILNLKTTPINMSLSGIGSISSHINATCRTTIQSRIQPFSKELSFLVIPSICGKVPNMPINHSSIPIPNGMKLADPNFNIPNEIDLLLGASIFWEILENNQIKFGKQLPILQETKLGYIVTGSIPQKTKDVSCKLVKTDISTCEKIDDIHNQLCKFWEIEECATDPSQSIEQIECENHFVRTTYRDENGKFVVSIPFKDSITKLGDSKQKALEQFHSLEKRLDKNQTLKTMYSEFMREYINLGHMTETNIENGTVAYYMPHHGVLKEDNITTKLRVVFNASCPTTSGTSLNDLQMTGPTIQSDLFAILVRFREHAYVVCADISKMYRQVIIQPDQRPLQTILWRFSQDQPVKEYSLTTVTYGTKSAPFLAIRSVVQLANENEISNKKASSIIKRDMYVDDLITGDNSLDELSKTCNSIASILKSGAFILRKWKSNSCSLLNNINVDSKEEFMKLGHNEQTKTLGIYWACNNDNLMYQITQNTTNQIITKRVLLSRISQIFDPLGLLGACTIVAKVLLQNLWLEKLSWDEPVSEKIRTKWVRFETELKELNNVQIPRYISFKNSDRKEIHAFCDASKEAFGACVYVRTINSNTGQIISNLLCAKSKVAPLKPLSVPRLELCAALLSARLVSKILKASNYGYDDCTFWSDSTIVLAWIKTTPNLLKCFVSNRIAEIQDLTKNFSWKYIQSKENPADILSRGISPSLILSCKSWWHGPSWLTRHEIDWPKGNVETEFEIPEVRKNTNMTLININKVNDLFDRFSSFSKLKRVVAYCIRFKNNCLANSKHNNKQTGALTVEEQKTAFVVIIKHVQKQDLSAEYSSLVEKGKISNSSKIISLNPFIDSAGLIRVGGRLGSSQFPYDKKHPIILPDKNYITKLILTQEHIRLFHAGPQQLLCSVREQFWPIGGKNMAKNIVRQCITCFKAKPRGICPLMGNLPASRITQMHPFMICGVDYGGPFTLKDRKGRGSKHYKAYIALFVCFISKAIHLEVVTDLTKDAFIATFRRFCSRRGLPLEMNSDNGTNFVGTYNELNDLGQFIIDNQNILENHFNAEGVKWKFIPPHSPHMGGLWEAGIRSAKYHIKRVAANVVLTYVEFTTLLNQIEAVLNSRPISTLSMDPKDPLPLTPAHFLIGRPLTSLPNPDVRAIPDNRLSTYQRIQQLQQHFWTRWAKEYISELQQRVKWKRQCKNLKEGDIVLVKEDHLPPMCWSLGIVVTVHPGEDSVIRVVTVKTSKGLIKRSVRKLCPLPGKTED